MKIGTMVAGNIDLYLGWEDTTTCIMGPRSGKTTGLAIPFIMEAPGTVLTTSNKVDILKATRKYREQLGKVWVLDPQGIAQEPATWYWNPITYVTGGLANGRDDRDVRAEALASRWAFSAGIKSGGEGNNSYFTGEARSLVMRLLLAASVLNKPVTIVPEWLNDQHDHTPDDALRKAGLKAHGDKLTKTMGLPAVTREGIYDTASAIVSFLTYQSIRPWVTPGGGREEFHPEKFVDTNTKQTLYSLSREGIGSMGALVSSLTVAVCEAGERLAERQGGRLEIPLVLVLDEIANVCKWEDLPSLYSHYGSRGILPIAFLQSREQGNNVWGESGMAALWGQSTNVIIGAGTKSNGFAESVVSMVGEDSFASFSTSQGKGGASRSVHSQQKKILNASDITALSEGRMLLVTTGANPVLLKIHPSYERYPKNPGRVTVFIHNIKGRPIRQLGMDTRTIVDHPTPDEATVYEPTLRPLAPTAPTGRPSKWGD